jgi:hypothetical protein
VMDAMGLSISLNDCFKVVSVVGSLDVSNNMSPTPFKGISSFPLTYFPSVTISGFPSSWLGTSSS